MLFVQAHVHCGLFSFHVSHLALLGDIITHIQVRAKPAEMDTLGPESKNSHFVSTTYCVL